MDNRNIEIYAVTGTDNNKNVKKIVMNSQITQFSIDINDEISLYVDNRTGFYRITIKQYGPTNLAKIHDLLKSIYPDRNIMLTYNGSFMSVYSEHKYEDFLILKKTEGDQPTIYEINIGDDFERAIKYLLQDPKTKIDAKLFNDFVYSSDDESKRITIYADQDNFTFNFNKLEWVDKSLDDQWYHVNNNLMQTGTCVN